MEYSGTVLSGKNTSMTIYSGDYAVSTTVRNGAKLRISSGGLVESTTVFASTTVSNAGAAESTFLSGGTMVLLAGGSAAGIRVLRNARLTVSSGAVATDVFVSSGNVNATVRSGDTSTLVVGVNEAGEFSLSNGVASNFLLNSLGQLTVSSGGSAVNTTIRFGGVLTVQSGGCAVGVIQSAGAQVRADVYGGNAQTRVAGTNVQGEFGLSNGVASNFILNDGGVQQVSAGASALHTLVSGQQAFQFVWSAGVASATSVFRNGGIKAYESSILRDAWIGSGGSLLMYDAAVVSGAVVSGALVVDSGSTGEGESGGLGTLADIHVAAAGKLNFIKGARISGPVTVEGMLRIGTGATVSNVTVHSGGAAQVSGALVVTTSAWNASAEQNGRIEVRSGAALVSGTALSGGNLFLSSGASAAETVLRPGGALTLVSGAETGGRLTWDFTGESGAAAAVNDLALLSPATAAVLRGAQPGGSYLIALSGDPARSVSCDPAGLYDNAIRAGESYTNAFTSLTYAFDAAGTAIAAAEFAVAPAAAAGSLTAADAELNGGDRAAKWDAATAVASGATIAVATAALERDAWLEIAGTNLSGTTLYGAAGEFGGTVNLRVASNAVLDRLAAGAEAGGRAGGVRLTVESAALGTIYAGGFGSVDGAVEVLVADGEFHKDLYAGALANYARTRTATSIGDVTLTVENGVFSGNIYGASVVRMGGEPAAAAHSVGAVDVTLTGGSAASAKFNLFGAGYATADAVAAETVDTVDAVTIGISGGSWGETRAGRGIFGGAFASRVKVLVAGDVNLTVAGGEMGNVYGGGWAQQGGASEIAGDVSITVTGGRIGNLFGGGSHSTSGGGTRVGSVSILVTGGEIAGGIFARGQLDGDVVAGDALVTFSGDRDFDCGVYGYSTVGGDTGAEDDVTLSFSGYTGRFSGDIGGFNGIELSGATAMTLDPAAADSIVNRDWKFDVSERSAELADVALLDWRSADFSDGVITLNLADAAPAEWVLAAASAETSYGSFDVQLDGVSILSDAIALDCAISGGTPCDGWGFTVEDAALKFKQLA